MILRRRHFLGLAGAALASPAFGLDGPIRAYNIEMLPRTIGPGHDRGDGWTFGLPPGIGSAAWPLDRNNGYPLQHGFTIRLPEDYRVHGPKIVALSFFATAFDHNDGGAAISPAIHALLQNDAATQPDDPELLPYWQARQTEHPRLHRMRDILDLDYAVILLSEAEFTGAFTTPPDMRGNRHLDVVPPPGWLSSGGGKVFWDASYFSGSLPAEEHFVYEELGGIPDAGWGYNRALSVTPRVNDPNAGIAPVDEWAENQTNYQQPWYTEGEGDAVEYKLRKWTKGHALNHIGGTMRPIQGVPAFSAYYIEFEESFGGYNFGSGNAQLDFKDMKFDWAQ